MAKAKKTSKQNTIKSQFKPEEWKEPIKGTKWPKEDRRRYIKKIAVDIGLYNVSKTELAQKLGISRWQLYEDIKGVYHDGLDKDKLSSATIEINAQLTKICKEMHKILVEGKAKTVNEKVRAAACLLDATEKHIDFLERFGIKDITTPIMDTNITVHFGKKPKEKI